MKQGLGKLVSGFALSFFLGEIYNYQLFIFSQIFW